MSLYIALMKIFLLLMAIFVVLTGFVGAADSLMLPADTTGPLVPYEISIERLTIDDQQLYDTIDVTVDSRGQALAAFDLKIAVDDAQVDILDILPGELSDSCNWEFFSARPIQTAGRDGYPLIVWQAVALSQLVSDTAAPVCFEMEGRVPLLRIVVSNAHTLEAPDVDIPIFFFWEDCTDNTLSGRTGNILLTSRRVFDYFGAVTDSIPRLFPSRTGAPAECIKVNARNPSRRMLDLHNGGVEFRLAIDPPDTVAPSAPGLH